MIATAKEVKGDITILKPDGQRVQLHAGDTINADDIIVQSSEGSSVLLEYPNATQELVEFDANETSTIFANDFYAQAIAHVSHIDGTVTVTDADGIKRILHDGDPLYWDDTITMTPHAELTITFLDGTQQTVASGNVLSLSHENVQALLPHDSYQALLDGELHGQEAASGGGAAALAGAGLGLPGLALGALGVGGAAAAGGGGGSSGGSSAAASEETNDPKDSKQPEDPDPPANNNIIANADQYTLSEGQTLNKTAMDGVARNDTLPTGTDTIRYVLVDNAEHGELTLNTDGSFEYIPAEYFSGNDSFSYVILDGNKASDITTVNLTVTAVATAPTLTVTPATAAENQGAVALSQHIDAMLLDTDGSESLGNLIITGDLLGGQLMLDNEILTANTDGEYIINHSAVSRLTYQAATDFSGEVDLQVAATSYELTDPTLYAITAAETLTITILPDATPANIVAEAKLGHSSIFYDTFAFPWDYYLDINGDNLADTAIYGNGNNIVFGQAQMPIELDMTNYNADAIWFMNGSSNGRSLTNANAIGDINHDGYDDLAFRVDTSSPHNELYVLLGGPENLPNIQADNLDNNDRFIKLDITAQFLNSYGVTDINGDGIDDFFISARMNNPSTGTVYAVYGTDSETNINEYYSSLDFSNLESDQGFSINESLDIHNAYITALPIALDLNQDGINEIFVQVSDRDNSRSVYVIDGSQPSESHLFYEESKIGLTLTDGSGDFNGDGINDLLFINSYNSENKTCYLIYGDTLQSQNGNTLTEDFLSQLTPEQGIKLFEAPNNAMYSTRYVGDINGDGYDELFLHDNGIVVFGGDKASNILFTDPSTYHSLTIENHLYVGTYGQSPLKSDNVGNDINGDGFDDILMMGEDFQSIQILYGREYFPDSIDANTLVDTLLYPLIIDTDLTPGDTLVTVAVSDIPDNTYLVNAHGDPIGAIDTEDSSRITLTPTELNDMNVLTENTEPFDLTITATTSRNGTHAESSTTVTIGDFDMNTIVGTDGDDTLGGLVTDDLFKAGAGNDEVFGNDGNDALIGMEGDDELHGGNGMDRLYGGVGDDMLFGDLHGDVLFGGAGEDILQGGHGDDRLHGGIDADTFVFASIFDGHDSIVDFNVGEDQINLVELFFSLAITDTDSMKENLLITDLNNQALITVDGYEDSFSVTLQHTKASELITSMEEDNGTIVLS